MIQVVRTTVETDEELVTQYFTTGGTPLWETHKIKPAQLKGQPPALKVAPSAPDASPKPAPEAAPAQVEAPPTAVVPPAKPAPESVLEPAKTTDTVG